ncbi:MAG: ferritin family protein [Clostridia bacterium]|nr:ferritin family protein [Clostridia bacterium]
MNTLEYAMKMENEGEAFYLEQADKYEGQLKKVFTILAHDEKIHAEIIKSKMENMTFELKDSHTLKESKSIFKDSKQFHSEYKVHMDQLDVYRLALAKEKESIDLYSEFLEKAVSEEEKALYKFLINQEQEHFRVLEDIIILVNRPNDWVESAEFGIRKEY